MKSDCCPRIREKHVHPFDISDLRTAPGQRSIWKGRPTRILPLGESGLPCCSLLSRLSRNEQTGFLGVRTLYRETGRILRDCHGDHFKKVGAQEHCSTPQNREKLPPST